MSDHYYNNLHFCCFSNGCTKSILLSLRRRTQECKACLFSLQMRGSISPSRQFWEEVTGFRSQYFQEVLGNTACKFGATLTVLRIKIFFHLLFQTKKYIILICKQNEDSLSAVRVIRITNFPAQHYFDYIICTEKKI